MSKQVPSLAFAAALLTAPAFAQDPSPDAPLDATPLFVRTMVLPDPSAAQERQFFGRIAALETAALSFEVPGYLEVLDAPKGGQVRAGDVIAALDLGPFERAVRRAELTLSQAERDLERAETLAQRNVASEVRAQDAQTARDVAAVALDDARAALRNAQIIAPFDGLIADRLVATFTNLSPGQPIVRVHNLSEVRVEFDLPERILTGIGDPAEVTFSAVLPGADAPTPLDFREIQAETGAIGQSYTISLALTEPLGPLMLPGKTVTVTAALPRQGDAVPVPASAVVSRPDGSMAVIALDETAQGLRPDFRPVGVTSRSGTDIAVTGIDAGTEIVALGAHLIRPGQPLARYEGLIVEGQ